MRTDFNAYLNEQKKQNLYSSKMDKVVIKEGFFDNKKYTGSVAIIDLESKDVITTLSNLYKNNDAAKILGDGASALSKGEKGFARTVKADMVAMFMKLKKATENLNKIFGITKADVTALASVEVSEKEIKYYFFKGPKKNPLAFAERFRDEVGRDPMLAPLKSAIDVDEATFYKADVQKKRKEEPFFDPKNHIKEIMNSPFVDNIVSSLKNKLHSEIKAAEEKAKKGNLVTVYSVQYKVDDELIKEVMKDDNARSLNQFYEILVSRINNDLVKTLNQIDDISEYIGFIPTKSYGFNLYFKDRDTAEIVSEKLSGGEDGKVSERKRYEKKLGEYYQLLIKTSEGKCDALRAAGVDASGAKDYFKGTLFARKHIAEMVKEKFPAADDQHVVLQYIVRYDKDELKKLLSNFNLLDYDDKKNIRPAFKAKLKEVLNNILKVYKDELVALTSEGTNLVFTFKTSASIDAVKNRIASAMTCTLQSIKVQKTTITEKEAQTFRRQLNELDDLESFYMAVDKLKGEVSSFDEKQKVVRIGVQLKKDALKAMLTDKYAAEGKDLIDKITKAASETKGFLGITVPNKDKGEIAIYFKDEESFTAVKEKILGVKDELLEGFNDPEIVTLNAEDVRNISSDTDSFINYLKQLFDEKQADANAELDKKNSEFTYGLSIPFSVNNFIKKHLNDKIGDLVTAYRAEDITESFKSVFKASLLKSINMLNEKAEKTNNDRQAHIVMTLELLKNKAAETLKEFMNNPEDGDMAKSIFDDLIRYRWTTVVDKKIKSALNANRWSDEAIATNYKSEVKNNQFILYTTGKAREKFQKILRTNAAKIFGNIYTKDSAAESAFSNIEIKEFKNFN